LNPFYKDSFFEGEKLKNDYASIAGGLITSRMYPWIFFTEIYYSSRVYREGKDSDYINIEGEKVNPLLLSIGTKFFFSDYFFIQISDIVNLLNNEGYIKNTVEFSMNIFF